MGEAMALVAAENWCWNGPNSGPPAAKRGPMFTPDQCQHTHRATSHRGLTTSHADAGAVSWALNAYHSRTAAVAGRA
jgi:hypothetical protein